MLNPMLYNTRHIAEMLSIHPSTVKKYSGLYARFLSANARPQDGAHRLFDTDDLKIFSYVVSQHKSGVAHDSIIVSIANGARGDLPDVYREYSLAMSEHEQLVILQSRITQLEAELEILRGERDKRVAAEAERDLLLKLLAPYMKP